jgi:hypothetical protein
MPHAHATPSVFIEFVENGDAEMAALILDPRRLALIDAIAAALAGLFIWRFAHL